MIAVRAVDKLSGNPHPSSGLTHASFQDISYAKFPTYLLHLDGLPL